MCKYNKFFKRKSCEFLIFLLDPAHDKKTEVCELIYEEFFTPLLLVLHNDHQNNLNFAQYLIEILIFCVRSHGFRIRQFIIQNKVFFVLLKLMKLKKKPLNLAILKLVKACLTSNDEVLLRYVHSNGFLLEVSELLFEKRGISNHGNLTISACLELFELIYKLNLKKFIKTLCENETFKQKINEKSFLKPFFEKIFNRYEQYKEEDPFQQFKPKIAEKTENDIEVKENLEELAYFESEENPNNSANHTNNNEVFNKEELKEKKEHLILLQNKIKRKLEEPKEEGLIFKKVNDENRSLERKKIGNLNFSTKIDIVFQEKL